MRRPTLPVVLAAAIAIALCCVISTQMNGESVQLAEEDAASFQSGAPHDETDVEEFVDDDVDENHHHGLLDADMSDDMTAEEKALVEAAADDSAAKHHMGGPSEHKETKLLSVHKHEKITASEDLTPQEKELIRSAASEVNKVRVHAQKMTQLPKQQMPYKDPSKVLAQQKPQRSLRKKKLSRKGSEPQKKLAVASSAFQETPAAKKLSVPVPKKLKTKQAQERARQEAKALEKAKSSSHASSTLMMEAAMEKITKAATKRAVQEQTKRVRSSTIPDMASDHVALVSARQLIRDDMPPMQKAQAKASEIKSKYEQRIKSVQVKSTWAQKLAEADRHVMENVKAQSAPLTPAQLLAAKELKAQLTGHQ